MPKQKRKRDDYDEQDNNLVNETPTKRATVERTWAQTVNPVEAGTWAFQTLWGAPQVFWAYCRGGATQALFKAAELGFHRLIPALVARGADVNAKDDCGKTPLHRAASYGQSDAIRVLVNECHADVNAKNNCGHTPLHWAVWDGQIDAIRVLVNECHADVNAKNNNGNTPLHEAAYYSHVDAIRVLVNDGHADVNAKNNYGNTPLRWAVMMH
ncbi:MAG TPA: ankyrin repeat domain-containing protein, partial [Gammaproteobacteria bacterium]|nr:ankyrin repeat domain-containing protein [Gammaproteobacteria bacterium]